MLFPLRTIGAFFIAISLATVIGCGVGGQKGKSGGDGEPTEKAASTDSANLDNSTGTKAKTADASQKVLLDTSLGQITLLLDGKKAVLTTANFLDYVDRGFYDGTVFHEVIAGYAVLGGGYTADLQAKQVNPPIRNEAHNGLKNLRGTVAMVRRPDVIDSATSQFLINLADNPALDHKDSATAEGYGYCVFGKVIAGMDVVDRIAALKVREASAPEGEPFRNVPQETVTIKSIRRVR